MRKRFLHDFVGGKEVRYILQLAVAAQGRGLHGAELRHDARDVHFPMARNLHLCKSRKQLLGFGEGRPEGRGIIRGSASEQAEAQGDSDILLLHVLDERVQHVHGSSDVGVEDSVIDSIAIRIRCRKPIRLECKCPNGMHPDDLLELRERQPGDFFLHSCSVQ